MICFRNCLFRKLSNSHKLCDYFAINTNICLNKRLMSLKAKEVNEEIIDVQKYREVNGIQCFGNSIPDPYHSFDCYKWPEIMNKRLRHLGFRTPTAVQSQTLPAILEKRDVVAIASSGSGKTLCFILPAIIRAFHSGLDKWPKCVVLTPTRELTHQIERVVKQFRTVRSVCLYGGVSYEVQEMLLKESNPHIVIATPSRLENILEKRIASLVNVDYVVVDEADLMLRMGFESSFRKIMHLLPQKRQTLMFSATWPQSVQTIADDFLNDYIRISVAQNQFIDSITLNKNIEQLVRVCTEEEKEVKLIECLNEMVPTITGFVKTIIFVRTKKTADRLVRDLKKENFPARALHSGKAQTERDFIIREFRKGSIPVLIASNVAARGLDFKNVKIVINYDFPANIEDYIHRIGRTGRHLSTGTAVTFFTSHNICHKTSLINVLRESNQNVDQMLMDLVSDSDKELNTSEDSGYDSNHESESNTEESDDSDLDASTDPKTNDMFNEYNVNKKIE